MLYLSDRDIATLGPDWPELRSVIRATTELLARGDYAQPIKPYLRYRNRENRIIAMPAYVGGTIASAGIKWIASFPRNIEKGLPRAHSVTILNDAETGVPRGIFNSAALSIHRTAAVTALMLEVWATSGPDRLECGICGFGPIGQAHLDMLVSLYGDRIDKVWIYDLKGVDVSGLSPEIQRRVEVVPDWRSAFEGNVFLTCTVSDHRYVDGPPKPGSLHLNVSLRDYLPTFRRYVDHMVVDDWDEVCRDNTDIERMSDTEGLQKQDVLSLADVVIEGALNGRGPGDVVMFNPMGMAVYDVAVASWYQAAAEARGVGTELQA